MSNTIIASVTTATTTATTDVRRKNTEDIGVRIDDEPVKEKKSSPPARFTPH